MSDDDAPIVPASNDGVGASQDGGAGPLSLIEDVDTGDRFLIYQGASGVVVELQLADQTFWASQRQMAEAFGVTTQNITIHLRNIFREGELDEAAVCKDSLQTARDGKRYATKLYNLNALISVGYRVGGRLGTAFRLWSTDKLVQYLTRGFVVDSRRLKAGTESDRVTELREIIRDIRAAEANVYAELRRICALCQDYDGSSEAARTFYTQMQAKLYWASLSKTPAMIRLERADADSPDMGLRSLSSGEVRKVDTKTAKNFLLEPELKELNRLTTILLDVFEDQLDIGRLTSMVTARSLLDTQLKNLNRPVLRGGGQVSTAMADAHVEREYRRFDTQRRALRAERTAQEVSALKVASLDLPKPRRGRPTKTPSDRS
ncbi:RhuM family protein [Lichenihabitans sp. Uapishka_5]|uniref:RhuM family protein n=1 Tax=Lichenihabitans sp. Uapishka_5 TaxID=3037302 RepID=UPI0029E815ED|nr:RhuM family protein [Lichenihabitans sp. Uapishka_5]MDX7952807.1 RhuM family protein [Lichenihabitans sp. Uapishka_5]